MCRCLFQSLLPGASGCASGSWGSCTFNFLKNHHSFPLWLQRWCIPSNSAQGSPFLHIPSDPCHLLVLDNSDPTGFDRVCFPPQDWQRKWSSKVRLLLPTHRLSIYSFALSYGQPSTSLLTHRSNHPLIYLSSCPSFRPPKPPSICP